MTIRSLYEQNCKSSIVDDRIKCTKIPKLPGLSLHNTWMNYDKESTWYQINVAFTDTQNQDVP